jgi:hypothetical protein
MAFILVLDTDDAHRRIVQNVVGSRLKTMQLIKASTDEEAIEKCREEHPSLVIIHGLPSEQETKEVMEVMREIDPGLPFVLISENGAPSLSAMQKLLVLHPAEVHKSLLNYIRDALGFERSFIVKRRRLKGGSEGSYAFYIDLLTHDITNINQGVMGYMELLSILPETTEQQRKYVSDSIGMLRMSMMLIDNVRKDFSSIERTKPVMLGKMLKEVTMSIREINPLRRIDVDIDGVPTDVKVIGSELLPDMFLQLMDFMVQRSIGPSQKFKFEVEPIRSGRIPIRIQCSGATLPEDFSRMLFNTSSNGGTAMGKLNICKRIAERIGGSVEYRLEPTQGGYSGGYYLVELKVVL